MIGPKGTVKVDTLAYERANNPDAKLDLRGRQPEQ